MRFLVKPNYAKLPKKLETHLHTDRIIIDIFLKKKLSKLKKHLTSKNLGIKLFPVDGITQYNTYDIKSTIFAILLLKLVK